MNKIQIPSQIEIEGALETAGNQQALSNYREAMSKGDKIMAIKIARLAGVLVGD